VTLETLKAARKWSGFPSQQAKGSNGYEQVCLGDLFHIKQGLATGSNEFFILCIEQADEVGIPKEFRRPILPGPRFVQEDVIERDANGYPVITPRLVLIGCPLSCQRKKSKPSIRRFGITLKEDRKPKSTQRISLVDECRGTHRKSGPGSDSLHVHGAYSKWKEAVPGDLE
jgi:hypothetical protein